MIFTKESGSVYFYIHTNTVDRQYCSEVEKFLFLSKNLSLSNKPLIQYVLSRQGIILSPYLNSLAELFG